jgi:hypothetical protein
MSSYLCYALRLQRPRLFIQYALTRKNVVVHLGHPITQKLRFAFIQLKAMPIAITPTKKQNNKTKTKERERFQR